MFTLSRWLWSRYSSLEVTWWGNSCSLLCTYREKKKNSYFNELIDHWVSLCFQKDLVCISDPADNP